MKPFIPIVKASENSDSEKPLTFLQPPVQIQDMEIDEVSAEELLNSPIENIPTLLDPLLPKTGLAALAGSSDTGKSSLLRQFAIKIATGAESFLGFAINCTHKNAIYVCTEDSKDAMTCLLKKQNKELKLTPDKYANLRFLFYWPGDLLQAIECMLIKRKTDVVIIDTFMDVYTSGIKDNDKIRIYLQAFSKLASQYECLILFLHHTGKATDGRAPSKHNFMGGQSFEAKVRVAMELRKDPTEPDIRHLCIVKGNYLPSEYKQESFALRFNEYMMFHLTGDRVSFEDLAEKENHKSKSLNTKKSEDISEEPDDGKDELIKDIILKGGYTYRKIQEELKVSAGRIKKVRDKFNI